MQLKDISASFTVSLIMAVAVYFLKYIPVSYWVVLPLQLLVGTTMFFVICEKIKLEEYLEIKAITKKVFDRIK